MSHDPFNAFLDLDPAAAGGDGALAGVTIGVKANIKVAGLRFHAGIRSLAGRIADADAEVVRRLREAGAVIVGTLNMEEGALGAKCDNPHFGPVQNPHRIGWSPGGSSGGSGAAVAAGLCDAALGSDTMGSIRIPAAHCGVYGFKPATLAVSQDGLEPADPALDAIGPIAPSLDMLERVAWVIAAMGTGIEDLAGAVLTGHGVSVHPAVAAAFDRVLALLPRPPAVERLAFPNARIRFAGFIRISRIMAHHLQGVTVSDQLGRLLDYGPRRADADWADDQRILDQTAAKVRAIVDRHGWIIMPTVPNPPFPHSEREPAGQADFACLANIAGLAAISLPMGWTDSGLPLGVQIVGRLDHEAGLFALARYLDTRLGAYRPPFRPANQ